jgi:hypothetical protein
MKLDFSKPEPKIHMNLYVKKMVMEFQRKRIMVFRINDIKKKLCEEKSKKFHTLS